MSVSQAKRHYVKHGCKSPEKWNKRAGLCLEPKKCFVTGMRYSKKWGCKKPCVPPMKRNSKGGCSIPKKRKTARKGNTSTSRRRR